MSLSPFVSFQSRFVTYLLPFPRINHREKRAQDDNVKRFLAYLRIKNEMGHEACVLESVMIMMMIR